MLHFKLLYAIIVIFIYIINMQCSSEFFFNNFNY